MEFDYNFTLLSLIFMRMSGCIMFNPILGRKNLPIIFKIGLTLLLAFFTYPLVPVQTFSITSPLLYIIIALKEFLIGYVIGFVIEMFMSVLIISGDMMDMQIGLSMSKIYDPSSNISMPLSASIINVMFMLIFFAANGHLTLIQIFVKLGTMIPYGEHFISTGISQNLVSLFSSILIYAVKMSLPILAAELITEVAVGLIMKAVPQINVFVVNIQLKVILGFAIILIMVPPLATFLERLITLMFDQINHILIAF